MSEYRYSLVRRPGSYAFVSLFKSDEELLAGLDRHGLISAAAYDMPIGDVIDQVNNVNGGEAEVTIG